MTTVTIDGVEQVYKRPVPPWVAPAKEAASAPELALWQALEEVEDPEYPVSVVDMGLIYGLRVMHFCIKDLLMLSPRILWRN